MSLHVDTAELAAFAVAVSSHGEELAARYALSDSRIDAAQAGWPGRAAAALTARAGQWSAEGRVLLARIAEHAQSLHAGALTFDADERCAASTLRLPR